MNTVLKKIKLSLKRVLFAFPTKLPVGMTEFANWSNSIIEAYEMPNNDTMKWALAGAILHLEATSTVEVNLLIVKLKLPLSSRKSKSYFGHYLRKMASNEIAAANLQIIKQKQQEEIKRMQESHQVVEAEFTSVGSGS